MLHATNLKSNNHLLCPKSKVRRVQHPPFLTVKGTKHLPKRYTVDVNIPEPSTVVGKQY